MINHSKVRVRFGAVALPTYLPAAPDVNPMFLEKRVYQGSSGKIYPLPFTDRVAETSASREWKAVWIENEFLSVMILPEIGGRIHRIVDKTNGYDCIYYQPVIKPALVGLAGPWISGGIEFNWPQHHRPATFLPVNWRVEAHADGSKTVWCSDHDPMARMKGMHGVCLHPGKAYVELKVRAYNRTPLVQTFLWWANVATRVHEAYQSFFPPDVYYVADHAKRAMSEYPLCKGFYYGVNYGERDEKGISAGEIPARFVPPHCASESAMNDRQAAAPNYVPNDLSFYANIPTPCSYMCMGSEEDFFGGYDYFKQAGIVHVANHHIAPGKKQWTWGNHAFGYAWDRNLTDADNEGEFGPYIELMAGVYTDNQPDFSFLQPGETKAWSQFWYPIQKIGPARQANLDAAVSFATAGATAVRLGVCVTRRFPKASVTLSARGKNIISLAADLSPGSPLVKEFELPRGIRETDIRISVADQAGVELISHQPKPRRKGEVPPPASEPGAPRDISSADELFITGLHLEQYRHATRCPTAYWLEALRRDPDDVRCNNALGKWHLRRGEFDAAEERFRRAIARLTKRNPNPYGGEAYYNLGLCLRYQIDFNPQSATGGRQFEEAYAAFYKATWNQAWAAASFHALAEMDFRRSDWNAALDHLDRSLRFDTDNLRARDLKAVVLRKLEFRREADALLKQTFALDPLDYWALHLAGEALSCDAQVLLDIAHDFARAGLYREAVGVLNNANAMREQWRSGASHSETSARVLPDQSWGTKPLVHYTLGWLHEKLGEAKLAAREYRLAAVQSPNYCFPSRLEEIAILESAMRVQRNDARAPYYLGNLFYDRGRPIDAIKVWERSAKLDPTYSVVWRNLGIAYFNILKQPKQARFAYDQAFRANPKDARLLFERDQLWKRLGEPPAKRLRQLEKYPRLVKQRDDLSVELCALYNQSRQPLKAAQLLANRRFQPWEGGEGQALGQHVRAQLALGQKALNKKDSRGAAIHFARALASPENLGEAKHLLANQSDVQYWAGCALDFAGKKREARQHWLAAATLKGDFQEVNARAFSEMTYYSALAWEKLGERAKAKKLLRQLLAYARKLQKTPAKIDYFATSLATMLLFEDNIQFRQETAALFLQAQAWLGLGDAAKARQLLKTVLKRDRSHALAADLISQNARVGKLLL